MNDLGYKLLVDKTVKRRIAILTALSETTHPLSLETIRTFNNSSIITLQNDITFLLDSFPNDLKIVDYNDSASLQKLNYSHKITNYINTLIQDSPLYFIIECLFDGKKEPLGYYSDTLFLSESTLRKHLNILKNVLKDYHITLSLSPLELIGKEINIRYFYFQYFRYSHTSAVLSVKQEHLTFIYDTLKEMIKKYGLVLNVDYYRVASWTLIFERRLSQGHYITFPPSLYDEFRHKNSFIKFNTAVREHFSKISDWPTLINDEILFAYLVRLDTLIYEDDKPYFTDDYFDQLNVYDELTTSFFSSMNISLSLNISLKIKLQAYLMNLNVLCKLSPLFQQNHAQLKRMVEMDYPDTLKIWNNLLQGSTLFEYPYDVAASLTLLTHVNLKQTKRVLFALTGEPSSITYYKARAAQCVPKEVDMFFLLNQPLNETVLENMSIDICVSNLVTDLHSDTTTLFKLSEIPLNSEWSELLNLLHSVN